MKITQSIRRAIRHMTSGFRKSISNNPSHKFVDSAYYITIGDLLYSTEPYIGWRKAYRAAKCVRSDAFIIKGSTLNSKLANVQMSTHKKSWESYGARS